jgi:hypothetical protein
MSVSSWKSAGSKQGKGGEKSRKSERRHREKHTLSLNFPLFIQQIPMSRRNT